MKNKYLKSKLASYGAISGAFLAAGSHEVEAQIVYMDLPDTQHCVEAKLPNSFTVSNIGSATSDERLLINLNFANGNINMVSTLLIPDGNMHFNVYAGVGSNFYTDTGHKRAVAKVHAHPRSNNNGISYPYNLSTNDVVGPTSFIEAASGTLASFGTNLYSGLSSSDDSSSPVIDGNFINAFPNNNTTGYLGVKFNIGADTLYGWVRINVEQSFNIGADSLSAKSCITILDYAYDSRPNTPIRVGQTIADPSQNVPTMGQWGLIGLNLLLMIFGVVAVKKRKGVVIEQKVRA